MKILFVGLGSIGKRNLRACQSLRPHAIYAALRSRPSGDRDGLEGVEQLHTLEQALAFQPDLIWVCNPTHLHAQAVQQLAETGAAFFIEKPLAHLSEDLQSIEQHITQHRTRFYYGCVMRQHPVIRKTQKLLQSGVLGRPLTYQLNCGSYLPHWRPGADYRKIYSSRRDQGGGVALDLIHEFDYAEWWFGEISELSGFSGRVSELEIDSHDLCLANTEHKSGVRGHVSLSYFRITPRRDFEICLTQGVIEGDLLGSRLCWRSLGAQKSENVEEFPHERDALYRAQAAEVFQSVEGGVGGSPWEVGAVVRLNRQIVDWMGQSR